MSENLNEKTVNYCPLCGKELNEEHKCENNHAFKKMCVNCQSSYFDGVAYFCKNEKNLSDAKKKLEEAIENSGIKSTHKVEVSIEPLPLKKPIAKCKEWSLNEEIKNSLVNLFV